MVNNGLCLSSWFGLTVTFILMGCIPTTQGARETDRLIDEAATCLATNVYHEARGESLTGQRAVADVTLNRVADARWPNDVCAVVWQPKQFSWTHDNHSDEMVEAQSRIVAYFIALEALSKPRVTDATHYHAVYIQPYWAKHLQYIERIGLHKFYK